MRATLLAALIVSGCAPEIVPPPTPLAQPPLPGAGVVVPANEAWLDPGVNVSVGEALTVTADGTALVQEGSVWKHHSRVEVGPEGTYLYDDAAAKASYPLPAGVSGPAPAWCLIGRIGDGPPFYIGRSKSWIADRSGPLLLGINDYDLSDNQGCFRVSIERPGALQPVAFQQPVTEGIRPL
ncbi:MAG: hypothetical protein KY476_23610, partial [Planctomycetes bacterium]|nr:hypothetical protein [Planctomycetota bacterium]